MYGNCIIPKSQRALYDIPAYIRKGVKLKPLPSDCIIYSLDPEKPDNEPQTPPAIERPVVVPKPKPGEEDTTKPPKRRRSKISLFKQVTVQLKYFKTNIKPDRPDLFSNGR